MIGVVTQSAYREIAQEFFELFKTPWEFCRADGRYDVVINTTAERELPPAKVIITYGAEPAAASSDVTMLSYNGAQIPIYGRYTNVEPLGPAPRLIVDSTGVPVTSATRHGDAVFIRIGYDLFREVSLLLTSGQPKAHAAIPTLERHIHLLRDCILGAGVPLVEIPPVPHGYRFTVCLTHDLDHPSIRLHRWDHTVAGFLYRATVGSLLDACRGRTSLRALVKNLGAVLRLPFIHLGVAEDFWSGFTKYLKLERGLRSTFFVIPARHRAGRTLEGNAPAFRASVYGVSDIAPQLKPILDAGNEVALHGIDAWIDPVAGANERDTVFAVTGIPVAGARMHWLFWSKDAPAQLELAGFLYDSTFGYNETVGFRAGTAQAFRPIGARDLLEIPLTIMDTALFYPSYLGLTQRTAGNAVWPIVEEVEQRGGVLTINWHDRSLAPERLWEDFYTDLLEELKGRSAWFSTMREAALWFRHRRSAAIERVRWTDDTVSIVTSAADGGDLPDMRIRVHKPAAPHQRTPGCPWPSSEGFIDRPFREANRGVDVVLSEINEFAAEASVSHGWSVTS
jgi:hypothetical protein